MSAVATRTHPSPTIPPAPPGPRGSALLGIVKRVQRDPLGFYSEMRREYGDVVRFTALSGRAEWYLVAGAEGVEHVLRANSRNYEKGVFVRPLRLMVGNGLVTSEGDFWLRQRAGSPSPPSIGGASPRSRTA